MNKAEPKAHMDLLMNGTVGAVLDPLGLKQKQGCTIWLDDRKWWVGVVEFQPSSWPKGVHLNVGCMWLFFPQASVALHEGYRHFRYAPHRDDKQFESAAKTLCFEAADKVREFRKKFATLAGTRDYLVARIDPKHALSLYFTGIACGLTGMGRDADRLLGMIESGSWTKDWEKLLKKRAQELRPKANDKKAFQNAVVGIVNSGRSALQLGRLDNPFAE
ncbi:MAG: hypothetical protein V1873_02890 [Verrucomicrobiota bacterium]